MRILLSPAWLGLTVAASGARGAEPGAPLIQTGGWTAPVQVVVLLTALALLPAMVMTVTPFLRITLVLHFLRQALGTQTAPSNQVLLGTALFLTVLLMRPLAQEAYANGWVPYENGSLSRSEAWSQGSAPLRKHLLRFAREKDIALLVEVARQPAPQNPEQLGFDVLIPAYVLSELRAGFQIGAVLFLPFLVIDLIVASATLSLGMVQLPPVLVSAPFKILLFVLADGWTLVIGSLLKCLS